MAETSEQHRIRTLFDRGRFLRDRWPTDAEPTGGLRSQIAAWQTETRRFLSGFDPNGFWSQTFEDVQPPSRDEALRSPDLHVLIHQVRTLSDLYHDLGGAWLEA
jgi:hypothetical protein